jgi:hypothetical protein
LICKCAQCNKEVYKKPSQVQRYRHAFCGNECKDKFQTKRFVTKCETCGRVVHKKLHQAKKSKSGKHFCGRSCSAKFRNRFIVGDKHVNYKHGTSTYREKALRFYGHSCQNENCPLSKIITIPTHMLDVDHVDEDRKNNKMENLRVLCVWCHAVKTRRHWAKSSVD